METNLIETPSQKGKLIKSDCLSQVIFMIAWTWVVTSNLLRLGVEYSVYDFYPNVDNSWRWALPIGQMALLVFPLVFLALFWKNTRYQGIYLAWLLTVSFGLINLPSRLVRATDAQLQAIMGIVLGFGYIWMIYLIVRRRYVHFAEDIRITLRPASWIPFIGAFFIGGLLAIPWLLWGALGSPFDTLLQVLQSIVFGVSASILIEFFIYQTLESTSSQKGWNTLLGGFSSGAVLLTMAALTGYPFGKMQILIAAVCSGLGWILAAIRFFNPSDHRSNWLFQAALISLVISAPTIFYDADELLLVIGFGKGELLQWAYLAAGISWLLTRVLGILTFVILLAIPRSVDLQSAKPLRYIIPAIFTVLAAAAWVVNIVLYFRQGQPGFYGETMFVILKDQADLSQASFIHDPSMRREWIYETLTDHASQTQAGLTQVFDNLGISYTSYYLENAVQVKAGPVVRAWLELHPEVDRVLDNPWLRPLPEPLQPRGGSYFKPSEKMWNLEWIGARRVWQEFGVTGEGILVGQSDSGAELQHPELESSYRGTSDPESAGNNYNWLDPWYGNQAPIDYGGHGTHTLGTILGVNTGVAPGANWIACVNLSRNLGNPALYLDCMQFMLAPYPAGGDPFSEGDPARGANVINNSWGCPEIEACDPTTLKFATASLRAAGVFVVASAGNEGPGCASLKDPLALFDEAFTVGAISEDGQLAGFSSIGPVTVDGSLRIKPDIMAPGMDVFSSTPNSTYEVYSGTSMAGPHVVGVVALMWSANPALIGDIERTEEILRLTASPYTGSLPNCQGAVSNPSTAVGYGILNAYEAVKLALEETP